MTYKPYKIISAPFRPSPFSELYGT